ncbi:Hypothetical_protein [Hexamita inflata]|uniref:Hypothetical_protein n=1 Tax=Hexamita inflata TaxID=28002 RepID=A0AA86P8I1_9EUKA|nr:Hypothetical protein HINF_LOCUS21762 [Hexamita inflata]
MQTPHKNPQHTTNNTTQPHKQKPTQHTNPTQQKQTNQQTKQHKTQKNPNKTQKKKTKKKQPKTKQKKTQKKTTQNNQNTQKKKTTNTKKNQQPPQKKNISQWVFFDEIIAPEYKEIKITDYVESIIDQMKINLTKYEIKATPRKIEGCNQPVVSPIKGPVMKHINTIMYIQKQVRNVSAANNVIADMCVRAKDIICVRVLQNAYQ